MVVSLISKRIFSIDPGLFQFHENVFSAQIQTRVANLQRGDFLLYLARHFGLFNTLRYRTSKM